MAAAADSQLARRRALRAALLCLSALALWPATAAHAQRLAVGVQAGRTRSTLRTEDADFGWRTGRLVGATLGVELASWVGADVEALVVERGAAGPDVFDMRTTYFELPLLLRLTAPRELWGLSPIVQGGVARSWEIECSGRTRPPSIGYTLPPPRPLECGSERTELSDVGVVMAGGIRWRAVGRRVQLQATVRSTRGTRNLARAFEPLSAKSRSTAILVGGAIRTR